MMIFYSDRTLVAVLMTTLFMAVVQSAPQGVKGRQASLPLQRAPFFATKGGSQGAASGSQQAVLPAFQEPPPAPAPEPDAGEPMMPYSFEYTADATNGMSARRETNDGQRVTGSYMLMGPDGLNRVVHYVADKDGFRATIVTNEPGTESQNPAATLLNSSQLPADQIAQMYGPREPPRREPEVQTQNAFSGRLQAPPVPALPAFAPAVPAPAAPVQQSERLVAPPSPASFPTTQTLPPTTTLSFSTPQAPLSSSAPVSSSAPLRLSNFAGTKGAAIVQQQTKSAPRAPVKARVVPPPPPPAPLVVRLAPTKTAPIQQAPVKAPLRVAPPPPPRPRAQGKQTLARNPRPWYAPVRQTAPPTTTTTTTTTQAPAPLVFDVQQQQQEEVQQVQQEQQREEIRQEQQQELQQEQESQPLQQQEQEQEPQQTENNRQFVNVFF